MSPESGWTSSSEDGSFGTSGDSDDWELDFVDQPLMAPAAESMAAAAAVTGHFVDVRELMN